MTKIFLDSGDPRETKEMISTLGSLDGQTTNPTLVAKNPDLAQKIARQQKFSSHDLLLCYQDLVTDLERLLPQGSVSIEVYADATTTADKMITQGRVMNTWIGNAHIKLPTTREGLRAAQILSNEGIKINMTLCFSQSQAAAIYAATKGAKKGDVFVSPFVGRLDDQGIDGMDLIKNILTMYRTSDGHVEVLTASVRNTNHLLRALQLNTDIITAPFSVLKEWGEKGKPYPDTSFTYHPENLTPIHYRELDLENDWTSFDINHELTEQGIERFAKDWNALLK